MRNLEQIRAARAYGTVATARDEELDFAIKLPVMLRTNGLLATWAFLINKREKAGALLNALADHLRGTEGLAPLVPARSVEEVFRSWIGTAQEPGLDGRKLRELTAEAIALSSWLKRAAEASTSATAPEKTARG